MNGESVRGFARRVDIRARKAADLRESMKCKLGVIQDASAVRIALMAEIGPIDTCARAPGMAPR
jgi:hypothetical protein